LRGGDDPAAQPVRQALRRGAPGEARGGARDMTRRSTILGALFLLVVGASALATYALWGQQVTVPVGVISKGNLDIELVGTASWTETSPDVAPAHAVGMLPDGETADHLATSGDSFTLTQDFTTELDRKRVV